MKNPAPVFRAFTIIYNGIADRIITQVKISQAFEPSRPPTPLPFHCETQALWDTGATRSVITRATKDALGLVPVGATMVNHAGGSSQANTYLVNFVLPNNVGVVGVLVSECPDIAGSFGAIIGMDIITKGDISITNVHRQTWMTFRTPSIDTIDYVAEANKIKFASVGRNDPCPCGKKDSSGRRIKFKKCCGNKKT